jgi:hypothetical protein
MFCPLLSIGNMKIKVVFVVLVEEVVLMLRGGFGVGGGVQTLLFIFLCPYLPTRVPILQLLLRNQRILHIKPAIL